jgi:hypothetical protein
MKRPIVGGLGVVAALVGVWRQLAATELAWPREFSYSGARSDTVWAIREQAYQDIGFVLLAFGLLLVLVGLVHWLWVSREV